MKRITVSLVALAVLAMCWPATASVAQRTILLPTSVPPQAGLNVTWHPGFQQYYAAGTGGGDPLYSPGYVFAQDGTPLQTFTAIEHDLRSLNYNPNTNKLEVATFNARDGGIGSVGGRPQGLFEAALDASGLFVGTTTQLLPSLPGLQGRQTMPVYDPGRDEFYSFSNTNLVHRVSRANGSLLGTVTLDTAAAGSPLTTWFGLGFDAENDYLVVTGYQTEKVYRFHVDGSYVDTWDLDIDVAQFYGGTSVVNGQLFVYDNAQLGWQGYLIPEPASLALFGLAAALLRRR